MLKVRLCGVEVNPLGLDAAARLLLEWSERDEAARHTRMVVTPNVDHVVMLDKNQAFRDAYGRAALALVDGKPLVWLARLLGKPVRERVAGSDLVPRVFELAGERQRQLRVYLLGAAPGVGQRAAEAISRRYPNVKVVGTLSPPPGFEHDPDYERIALDLVRQADPDLLLVGLGAPKQELWVARHLDAIAAKVTVCAGATIDFLAGERTRAPTWMRRFGMEWLHRVLSEPRRLGPRYLRDALALPRIFAGEIARAGALAPTGR